MRQVHLELRELIEDATEDERRGGDSRVVRVAQQVLQVIARGALACEGVDRVQEDSPAELFGPGVHIPEAPVVEVRLVNVRREVQAAHSGKLRGTLELLQRELRGLHRQHREPHEARRIFEMRGGRGIVVRLREREPEAGRCPIHHGRRERKRLHVHALPIHARQPQTQIHELLVEGVHDALGADGVSTAVALEARAFGGAVLLEKLEPFRGVPVGVRVDGAA